MAERGAYLTGTIKSKPSIFEIVAQESLSSTLEPAFKKILSVSKQISIFVFWSSKIEICKEKKGIFPLLVNIVDRTMIIIIHSFSI